MTTTLLPLQSSAIQLREAIEYPAAGVLSGGGRVYIDSELQSNIVCGTRPYKNWDFNI